MAPPQTVNQLRDGGLSAAAATTTTTTAVVVVVFFCFCPDRCRIAQRESGPAAGVHARASDGDARASDGVTHSPAAEGAPAS